MYVCVRERVYVCVREREDLVSAREAAHNLERESREVPGKGNSNSHGARPVHRIITMIKWIRTSRLSIKNYLAHKKAGRESGEVPVRED